MQGDWAIRRTGGRRLLIRNICVAVASLGPTTCLLLIIYLEQPSNALILTLILITHFCGGVNAAGSYCVILDIFPGSAAAFTGVDNTIAQSTGIFAPLMTGVLLDLGHCPTSGSEPGSASGSTSGEVPESCLHAWHVCFGICAALYAVGWLLFVILTLCEKRYWQQHHCT
jgi:MFS family permease